MSISDVGTVKQDEQGFITPFLFFGGDARNCFVQNDITQLTGIMLFGSSFERANSNLHPPLAQG